MLQKIISLLCVVAILCSLGVQKIFANGLQEGERYFIVTAYYSPLPNQQYYAMGTYAAEKRMNGEGIRGASGRKVYGGMLAAPGKYAFGTKIHLEGVGVGSVEDRGGAIVAAGQRNFKYDRIDVWVGYGDEGLRRAMFWGKKTIKGKILSRKTQSYINIANLPSPQWVSVRTIKNPYYITPKKAQPIVTQLSSTHPFFNYGIGTKSKKSDVLLLQEFLKEIGMYSGKIDGVYNTVLMQTIYDFQKKHGIVANWKDINAGYWSLQTRELIWKKYKAGEYNKKVVAEPKVSTQNNTSKNTTSGEDIYSRKLENSADVQVLQKELIALGLYEGKITGNYADIKNIILKFQLDNKLLANSQEQGAGYYGPKTRAALQKYKSEYAVKIKEQQLEEKKKKEKQEKEEAEKRKKLEEEKQAELQKIEEEKKKKTQKQADATARVQKLKGIKLGDVSAEVRELQKILKELGYFDHKDTAIFGEKTKQALIDYQLDTEVITDVSVYGAGMFGPKTQSQIISDLSN